MFLGHEKAWIRERTTEEDAPLPLFDCVSRIFRGGRYVLYLLVQRTFTLGFLKLGFTLAHLFFPTRVVAEHTLVHGLLSLYTISPKAFLELRDDAPQLLASA